MSGGVYNKQRLKKLAKNRFCIDSQSPQRAHQQKNEKIRHSEQRRITYAGGGYAQVSKNARYYSTPTMVSVTMIGGAVEFTSKHDRMRFNIGVFDTACAAVNGSSTSINCGTG